MAVAAKLSVVLGTYNRLDSLRRCIGSIPKRALSDFLTRGRQKLLPRVQANAATQSDHCRI